MSTVTIDIVTLAQVVVGLTAGGPNPDNIPSAVVLSTWSTLVGYDPEAEGHDLATATAFVRAQAQGIIDGTTTPVIKAAS